MFTNNTKIVTFRELIYFAKLKTMGRSFVSGCSQLTEIWIPASVNRFGNGSFASTPRLKKILCYPQTVPETADNGYIFGNASATSTGYNTRNSGTNEFHVPVGATGYDSSWTFYSKLTSTSYCGFTVIYDL